MLRRIHPLLGPDLLNAIALMGHGDEIVIADANFPSATIGPKMVRADGLSATDVLRAVLSHFPLDSFAEVPAWRMEVVGDPKAIPPVCAEFQQIVTKLAGDFEVASLERFAFYERSRSAAYVVATGEQRLYGNIILKKGVVTPEEAAGFGA